MKCDVMSIQSIDGKLLDKRIEIGMGSYKRECKMDAPGIFDENDAVAFVRRVSEVNPIYLKYLGTLTHA